MCPQLVRSAFVRPAATQPPRTGYERSRIRSRVSSWLHRPADALIEALRRGCGIRFATAIADLIDNSISASSDDVWLIFWWERTAEFHFHLR